MFSVFTPTLSWTTLLTTTLVAVVQAEDVHVSFLFVGDLNGHNRDSGVVGFYDDELSWHYSLWLSNCIWLRSVGNLPAPSVVKHYLSAVVANFWGRFLIWDNFYAWFNHYHLSDVDNLLTSVGGVKAEDMRVSLVFLVDLNCHHQEWFDSTTTNRHGVAAFDFATVSGCNQ